MKWFNLFLSLVVLFCTIGNPTGLAQAATSPTVVSLQFPKSPATNSNLPPSATLTLPPLKAVLVVGPFETDSWTTFEIGNANKAKVVLEQNGVQVTTFYSPNNNWEQIKTASVGAHFFMYRGRGILWGVNPEIVGGMVLKGQTPQDEFLLLDNAAVGAQLRLAPNAIVMVTSCYAAGSYGTENGQKDFVTAAVAKDRVRQFADPYMDNGAAGYYSAWAGDAFKWILGFLFSGQTLRQAFESYGDYNRNPITAEQFTFDGHPGLDFWLDYDIETDIDNSGRVYDYAYVGKLEKNLEQLFGNKLVATPTQIVRTAIKTSSTTQHSVVVTDMNSATFSWSASIANGGAWAVVTTPSGVNGGSARVSVNPRNLQPGIYLANLTISTTAPGFAPSTQTIPVKLTVITLPNMVYLPVTIR